MPIVNTPTPCWYTHPLSICLPPVNTCVNMPTLLSIHPLPVDMPACCWYTHPLSIHLPCCQYAHLLLIHPPPVDTPTSCQYAYLLLICLPAVHMPALWLMQLPPVNMPTSCWCSCPYWYICAHVAVVCHGAADDGAGSIDAIMPTSLKEGRGKECELMQILPVGGTCGWWEEQWHFSNCIVTQVTGVTQSHNTSN